MHKLDLLDSRLILHIGFLLDYSVSTLNLFVCFDSALIFYLLDTYFSHTYILGRQSSLFFADYNYSVCFSFSITGVFIIFVCV